MTHNLRSEMKATSLLAIAATVVLAGCASGERGDGARRSPSGGGGDSAIGAGGSSEQPPPICGTSSPGSESAGAFWFLGCTDPPLELTSNDSETTLSGLEVVEVLPFDASACPSGSVHPMHLARPDYVAMGGPGIGLSLRDSGGRSWLLELALGEVPSELIRPGDVVDLRFRGYYPNLNPHQGYFVIENESGLLAFLGFNDLPRVSSVPDLAIAGHETECLDPNANGAERCGFLTVRATANGESAILGSGGEADLGGLVLRNAYYRSVAGCACCDRYDDYLIAGYTTP